MSAPNVSASPGTRRLSVIIFLIVVIILALLALSVAVWWFLRTKDVKLTSLVPVTVLGAYGMAPWSMKSLIIPSTSKILFSSAKWIWNTKDAEKQAVGNSATKPLVFQKIYDNTTGVDVTGKIYCMVDNIGQLLIDGKPVVMFKSNLIGSTFTAYSTFAREDISMFNGQFGNGWEATDISNASCATVVLKPGQSLIQFNACNLDKPSGPAGFIGTLVADQANAPMLNTDETWKVDR